MSASEKANLARIRDNQRRSRARRKEYLQELETRLRQCELQGVEASAEIQTAARHVAAENGRLRQLLNLQGVNNANIDAYLKNEACLASGEIPSLESGTSTTATQALEQLLDNKISCCGPSRIAVPSIRSVSLESGISLAPSEVYNPGHSRRPSEPSSHTHLSTASLPRPAASRPSPQHLAYIGMPTQALPQVQSSYTQQHVHYESPRALSMQPQAQHRYPSGGNTYEYSDHQTYDPHDSTSSNHDQFASSYPPYSSYPTPSTTSNLSNMNGCAFAAEMISGMAGGDPKVIRQELGCRDASDGQTDCQVDNQVIFNVMDRYTGMGM